MPSVQVRSECIDGLVHGTLAHRNLVSLTFAPMMTPAWQPALIQEINERTAPTLKSLAVNFRPFQEVNLAPLAELDLPALEHLELRAQNEEGFGPNALAPLVWLLSTCPQY